MSFLAVNVLRIAVYRMQWMILMLIRCRVAVKRMGMLGLCEDVDSNADWYSVIESDTLCVLNV